MNAANSERAIIVGHVGQDGSLLLSDLERHGCEVLGIGRSSIYHTGGGIFSGRQINITDRGAIQSMVEEFDPQEVYYLAANHTSSQESEVGSPAVAYQACQEVHVKGLLNFLDAIRQSRSTCRLFYASSSLIFSGKNGEIQDESTPLSPKGFYAITKVQGMWLCKEYRENFGVYASVGILYNHESCLRNPKFLSQKIVQSAIRIAAGSAEKLIVGDLAARVDWGYAPDFVDAFQRILKLDESGEFIIATGSAHTVQTFVEIAFKHFGLNWREYVVEDNSILLRRLPVKIGNSEKLQAKTGWGNSLQFDAFVQQLIFETQAAMEISQCKN
jgi:GDPmannose 4,6-dehydratase